MIYNYQKIMYNNKCSRNTTQPIQSFISNELSLTYTNELSTHYQSAFFLILTFNFLNGKMITNKKLWLGFKTTICGAFSCGLQIIHKNKQKERYAYLSLFFYKIPKKIPKDREILFILFMIRTILGQLGQIKDKNKIRNLRNIYGIIMIFNLRAFLEPFSLYP